MTNTYPTQKQEGIHKATGFINGVKLEQDRQQIFQIEYDDSFASTVLYGVDRELKTYSLRTTYRWTGNRNIGLLYCHLKTQKDFITELRDAMAAIGYQENANSIRNNYSNWQDIWNQIGKPFVSWW